MLSTNWLVLLAFHAWQVSVAVGDTELAAKFNVAQTPAVVVLPFGTGAKTPKQVR